MMTSITQQKMDVKGDIRRIMEEYIKLDGVDLEELLLATFQALMAELSLEDLRAWHDRAKKALDRQKSLLPDKPPTPPPSQP